MALRGIAATTTGLAIVGFLVGLSFTVRGGDTLGVVYHVVVLPDAQPGEVAWAPPAIPPPRAVIAHVLPGR